MIQIKDKKDCCGCSACVQKCPKQCISLKEDTEGFLYPVVDNEACIDCGLCEKVCPVLHQGEPHKPLEVYAAKNQDEEIRRQSSSGGIFTLLAEQTINEGGVVFGARFDENWEVKHDYTETIEGLAAFRGSKYVQSRIEDNYKKAEEFLKQGRKVLFSGTPCQIVALKRYLRKYQANLLTIDVVCHGVPSPLVWYTYLEELNNDKLLISYVNFRSKDRGWSQYSYKIKTKDKVLYDDYAYKSEYSQGFSLNLTLRPSCYSCTTKSGRSQSDITLADCWGIHKLQLQKYDNMGYSAVLINTENGNYCFSRCMSKMEVAYIDYSFIVDNNNSIVSSAKQPYCRKLFWKNFPSKGMSTVTLVSNKLRQNILLRIYNKLYTLYNSL